VEVAEAQGIWQRPPWRPRLSMGHLNTQAAKTLDLTSRNRFRTRDILPALTATLARATSIFAAIRDRRPSQPFWIQRVWKKQRRIPGHRSRCSAADRCCHMYYPQISWSHERIRIPQSSSTALSGMVRCRWSTTSPSTTSARTCLRKYGLASFVYLSVLQNFNG